MTTKSYLAPPISCPARSNSDPADSTDKPMVYPRINTRQIQSDRARQIAFAIALLRESGAATVGKLFTSTVKVRCSDPFSPGQMLIDALCLIDDEILENQDRRVLMDVADFD